MSGQGGSLFVVGAILMRAPMGLNPQDVAEEFGGDFAVKPVLGARQPREFVGPSDRRMTLAGTIFPFRFAAAGGSDGQAEIAQLESYANAGEPIPITRGGRPLGFYVIEKVQLRHSHLSTLGTGRQQEFVLQMALSPNGPSTATALSLFTGLITALGQIGNTAR